MHKQGKNLEIVYICLIYLSVFGTEKISFDKKR